MLIRSESEREELVREISSRPLPFRVTFPHGRTVDQNALSHVWYREIELQGGEMSAAEARRFCKLTFGIPILAGDDEEYRNAWSKVSRHLIYPEKLETMDFWPVTSIMNPKQMSDYLTAVQENFARRMIILTGHDRGESQYPEAQ